MGMFDYVSKDLTKRIIDKCPLCCSKDINNGDWQTISFSCILTRYNVNTIPRENFSIYTICPNCHQYINVCVSNNMYCDNVSENYISFVDSTLDLTKAVDTTETRLRYILGKYLSANLVNKIIDELKENNK